jgi:hypothetical protein
MQRTSRITVLESPNGSETPTTTGETPRPRRTRRYRKRVRVGMPQSPAPAVRELWKRASLEERQAAHRKGTLVLAMWLGRKTKAEVASELSLPPLRVWQLSQMALSGMLAGLLKQPRSRRRKEGASMETEESPSQLRRRIAKLEQENRDLREVLNLIGMMPSVEERPSRSKTATQAGDSRRGRKRATRPRGGASSDRDGPVGSGPAPAG